MTDVPAFIATHEHDLADIPDPNGHPNMVGEVLPDDEEPDGDR